MPKKLPKPSTRSRTSHFALLEYILQLVFGGIFLCTFFVIARTAIWTSFFSGVAMRWCPCADAYAVLISAFIISAAAYLIMVYYFPYARNNFTPMAERARKVLQVIFTFILTLIGLGYSIYILATLVVNILNPTHFSVGGFFAPILTATVSIALVLIVFTHHTHSNRHLPKHLYPAIVGTFAVVFLILFAIFVGPKIRDFYTDHGGDTGHKDDDSSLVEEIDNCGNPDGVLFPGETNCIRY